jgi:hypothetical protein
VCRRGAAPVPACTAAVHHRALPAAAHTARQRRRPGCLPPMYVRAVAPLPRHPPPLPIRARAQNPALLYLGVGRSSASPPAPPYEHTMDPRGASLSRAELPRRARGVLCVPLQCCGMEGEGQERGVEGSPPPHGPALSRGRVCPCGHRGRGNLCDRAPVSGSTLGSVARGWLGLPTLRGRCSQAGARGPSRIAIMTMMCARPSVRRWSSVSPSAGVQEPCHHGGADVHPTGPGGNVRDATDAHNTHTLVVRPTTDPHALWDHGSGSTGTLC